MVKKAVADAPTDPNVDMTANPIGPQLHAPATAPIKDPKTPPPIFCFDFLRVFILKMFIGRTSADNADNVTINTNPNSVPDGIWLTT